MREHKTIEEWATARDATLKLRFKNNLIDKVGR